MRRGNRPPHSVKPYRRSKTAGTATGDVVGMIQVRLDAKTIVFCKTQAEADKARAKWEKRQQEKNDYLKVGANTSQTQEYKRKHYLKHKEKKNAGRSEL